MTGRDPADRATAAGYPIAGSPRQTGGVGAGHYPAGMQARAGRRDQQQALRPPDGSSTHPQVVRGLRSWCSAAVRALGAARTTIDECNVYPVPDADTGTNLFLTMRAAASAVGAAATRTGPSLTLASAAAELSHGALMGARGNSGVIVSQLLRGALDCLVERADERGALTGGDLAAGLHRGADAAYAAVAHPVEGTILTVARAAAEAAGATTGSTWSEVAEAALAAARRALERTPEQLPVLRDAHVVDAGGMGLVVLLEALVTSLGSDDLDASWEPFSLEPAPSCRPESFGTGSGAYEVMFLLDADEAAVTALRATLDRLGESLLVVGGAGLWHVHVHTADPGAVVEAGYDAGHAHRVRITHLPGTAAPPTARRALVAVAAGPGIAALLESSGAVVVPGGPGARPSTAEVLAGIRRAGAAEVVVLPNDRASLEVAEAAAALARPDGVRVAVVPTTASVQVLAAAAVHDDGHGFDDDVVAMTSAAGLTRHGGVTLAARDAITMAGPCREGDVLGVVGGDFAIVGDDLAVTACGVADRMLAAGGELVTLLVGEHAPPGLADAVVAHVRRSRRDVDTVVYDGGQPRYPLLIGVE